MSIGFYALTGITFLYEFLDKGGHTWEPKTTANNFGRLGFTPVALEDTGMMGSDHSGTNGLII